ncbi:MAG: CDP-diacylglycerol--glycerol-3-phosphate 3-phosphatidyltransferase [Oscillospiraceae bacterium]|nr:CDP-diacylglycerol--glycerol-3-phosphate 3-phosphatidyltransferase [Oscillospiraceae bacterium]
MNLANKLTIFRVVLVPFFVFFMLTDLVPYSRYIAFAIFVVATITDKLDGTIARKYNMISSFGKFMDPIADKLLVSSALICMTALGEMPAWVVLIIIAREFAISGIRLVAADNGVAIAASWWGKSKTIAQMLMIIIMLPKIPQLYLIGQIVMYIALVLTVVSLIDYIVKNRKVLALNNM